MRLGLHTNGKANEYQMQEAFSKFLGDLNITFVDEFHVTEVKRRADFLLIKNGLINVEAKCTNLKELMKQLDDHSTYCKYCFALIPDYTWTPEWFKKKLAKRGYGLIVHNYKNNIITEVLEAHQNKITNTELNKKVLFQIRNQYINE